MARYSFRNFQVLADGVVYRRTEASFNFSTESTEDKYLGTKGVTRAFRENDFTGSASGPIGSAAVPRVGTIFDAWYGQLIDNDGNVIPDTEWPQDLIDLRDGGYGLVGLTSNEFTMDEDGGHDMEFAGRYEEGSGLGAPTPAATP